MDPNSRAMVMGAAGAGSANALYATDVFQSTTYTGTAATQALTTGINLLDNSGLEIYKRRDSVFSGQNSSHLLSDLCWGTKYIRGIVSSNTNDQFSSATDLGAWTTSGTTVDNDLLATNNFGNQYVLHTFRNAPKFFQAYNGVVDISGAVSSTLSFSQLGTLGMVIVLSSRSATPLYSWHRSLTAGNLINFNSNAAQYSSAIVTVSGTDVTITGTAGISQSVAVYAFAHNAGGFGSSGASSIVQCGSYTGTGTTQQVDCGFAAGARFVMIKRANGTGDWYIWDTARGIVSGNDPYWRPNSINIEVANTDYIDPYSAGFEISSSAPSAINASGGSFIYLAIA